MSKTLFDLIAEIESKNNLQAMRFEPKTYAGILLSQKSSAKAEILARIQKIHACSCATSMVIYSTSYGAIQLMGFNLYSGIQYKKTVFDFSQNIVDQQNAFAMFCVSIGQKFTTPLDLATSDTRRSEFARLYNGSQDYTVPMCAALKKLGFTVQ